MCKATQNDTNFEDEKLLKIFIFRNTESIYKILHYGAQNFELQSYYYKQNKHLIC